MDFKDSPADAAWRSEVRSFLDANARRKTPAEEESMRGMLDEPANWEEFVERSKAWQKTLYDNGYAAITWPEEYGGKGASPMQAFILREEMSHYDVPAGAYTIGLGMIGPTLISHGTEDQKKKYLPKMLEGSEIWCQLWSEPNAGSDVASLQTKAERTGTGDWILNGQKVWTTGAHYSDWGLIIARTDQDAPKHKGISAFIVNMRQPGVEVRPIKQINGASGFNEVYFTDAQVDSDQIVGEENDGWRVALTTLMNERFAIGVGGSSGASLKPLVSLARQTPMHGAPALEDSAIRQELAEIVIRGKLLSLTGYRALTKVAKGGIPGAEGSTMKSFATNLATRVGDLGTKILGLRGALRADDEFPDVEKWAGAYLGAPGIHLAGGTDEIMKNIIGERVLGLPKEPQVDKELPFREAKALSGS